MTKKDEKRIQIKEYEKLTKIVKEAFRNAAQYTKKDTQSSRGINFKSC